MTIIVLVFLLVVFALILGKGVAVGFIVEIEAIGNGGAHRKSH
jgi:hypothetical protein